MCNGHKFVKSSLFRQSGYLVDLSPNINAVISSILLTGPMKVTSYVLKPLAKSILPTKAGNYFLSDTLTCENCLHQVYQDNFDDGRPCPKLLLENLSILETDEFVLAEQLLEAQEKKKLNGIESHLPLPPPPHSSDKASSTSDVSALESSQSFKSQNSDFSGDVFRYKDDLLIMKICPEIGLHAQNFKCVECNSKINLNAAKLCDYDGRYYCITCHTNSFMSPTPARILKNWDFTPKSVSKTSWHKICYLRTRPILFNLFKINSMLYGFIDLLVDIKQLRNDIQSMLNYITVCGQPEKPSLTTIPKHYLKLEMLNFFGLNDLLDINNVFGTLSNLQLYLEDHITKSCESCRGKGYYCELCKDPREVLYPFFKNAVSCQKCSTVFHKTCFQRKKKNCPRCSRLASKK